MIGTNVTGIGNNAFQTASELKTVIFAENSDINEIGIYAFANTPALETVTFAEGSNINTIREYAFTYSNLETFTFETNSKLTYMKTRVFSYSNLTTFTFEGDSQLIDIDSYGFEDTTTLLSITIPESVTRIGGQAFNRSGLTSVTLYSDTIDTLNTAGADPSIPTVSGQVSSFYGAGQVTITVTESLTIFTHTDGSTVTLNISGELTADSYIGTISKADISSVTIGTSVTKIMHRAFQDATSLTSITIGTNVTKIYPLAFVNTTSLISITIPDSVTFIGDNAFNGASALTSIIFAGNSLLETIELGMLDGASSLTSITIPDSVISIGNGAFNGATSLTSISIPEGVISIGPNAFLNATSLTSVTLYSTNIGTLNAEGYASTLIPTESGDVSSFYNSGTVTTITVIQSEPAGYQFADLTELKTAVNLWISDKSSALSTYGEINEWVTTSVTDI